MIEEYEVPNIYELISGVTTNSADVALNEVELEAALQFNSDNDSTWLADVFENSALMLTRIYYLIQKTNPFGPRKYCIR